MCMYMTNNVYVHVHLQCMCRCVYKHRYMQIMLHAIMTGCRGEAGEAAAEAAAAAAETRGRDECSCQSLEQRDPHTLGNHVRTQPPRPSAGLEV